MFSNFIRKFTKHRKKILFPTLLLSIPAMSTIAPPSKDDKELLQVYWVIRHGWRTPISMNTFQHLESIDWECFTKEETEKFRDRYIIFNRDGKPLDKFQPYFNMELDHIYGKCHKGQLTLLGQEQVYNVGRIARDIYINTYKFLDPYFDLDKDLYVRSTSTGRTVETAFQFTKGLSTNQLDKDDSKLRVHLYSYDKETMLARTSHCPKIHQEVRTRRREAKKELYNYIKEIFDADSLESQGVFDRILNASVSELCNNLSILRAHNYPIPTGIEDIHIDKACELSGKYYSNLYNKDSLKVAIGGFIREINETILSKSKSDMKVNRSKPLPTDNAKFIVAAGHDTTLFPLLLSYGIFDGHHPPMASSLGVELWKNNKSTTGTIDDYYVKLMYNFKEMPIPECNNQIYCPLKDFIQIGENYIQKDFENECN